MLSFVNRLGAGLFFLLLPSSALTAAPLTINGMAGKVAGRTLTLEDARLVLALQKFREGKPNPLAEPTQSELKTSVQRALLDEMVYAELRSLRFDGGTKGEADRLLADLKKKRGVKLWQQILTRFRVTEAVAVERIWKSLQVEKFLQRRVDTMTPIPTPIEIDRYLRQKRGQEKATAAELESLRPQAAQELKKEMMRKELEEWITLLKRKYTATNYLDG